MTTAERPTTLGFIYVSGHNSARLDSFGNIYCCDSGEKFATATRDGKVYSLDGNFTGLYLRPVGGNDTGGIRQI